MIISVYGMTDKRPVIYTLVKLLQRLGDTCLISDNRQFKRLLPDGELSGHYQNTYVCISDNTPDEIFELIGYTPNDFEHIIFDNSIPDNADMVIYVEGAKRSEMEEDTLDCLTDYQVIKLGTGAKSIPYSVNMLKNVEILEANQYLLEIDKKLTRKIAEIMSPILNLPVSKIAKVVASK